MYKISNLQLLLLHVTFVACDQFVNVNVIFGHRFGFVVSNDIATVEHGSCQNYVYRSSRGLNVTITPRLSSCL